MKVTGVLTLPKVLAALEQFGDEELHAVIARAQGLLLDRPAERGETPALAVEVVAREESHLLAAYRALAPLAQRRVLSRVVRLVRAPRRMGRHLEPATTTAAPPPAATAAAPPRAAATAAPPRAAATAAPPPAAATAAPPVSVGAALLSRSRRTIAS